LKPTGGTDFLHSTRQFITEYSQRGLLILISDFLEDEDCLRPLQYLADFGHELLLVQLWGGEDRSPAGQGELELVDAETGDVVKLGFDDQARQEYTARFDRYSEEIRRLAQRNGGRYAAIPASTMLEEAVFGMLIRSRGVA
jgi:hypothetical protein